MTIEEMDDLYSKLKDEYYNMHDKLETAKQLEDVYIKEKVKSEKDCKILVKKLLEAKPELEDWIKKNFEEYL